MINDLFNDFSDDFVLKILVGERLATLVAPQHLFVIVIGVYALWRLLRYKCIKYISKKCEVKNE